VQRGPVLSGPTTTCRYPHHYSGRQAASAAHCELVSVVDPRAQGQETPEVAYVAGKSATRATIDVFADAMILTPKHCPKMLPLASSTTSYFLYR
jgi:hypothetical protein